MKNYFNENQDNFDFRINYKIYCAEYRTMIAPVGILYDKTLDAEAKVLFLIISGLCFKQGYCFATNKGLSARLGLGVSSVNKYIKQLEAQKLIYNERFQRKGVFRRKLYIEIDELRSRYLTITEEEERKNVKSNKGAD